MRNNAMKARGPRKRKSREIENFDEDLHPDDGGGSPPVRGPQQEMTSNLKKTIELKELEMVEKKAKREARDALREREVALAERKMAIEERRMSMDFRKFEAAETERKAAESRQTALLERVLQYQK